MTTEKKIPKGCVCNLLSTATCARGSFRCDRRHKVTTADQDTLRAELDAARAREAELTRTINRAWAMIENCYEVESRAECEASPLTHEGFLPIEMAIHAIGKRDPNVAALVARETKLREALEVVAKAPFYGRAVPPRDAYVLVSDFLGAVSAALAEGEPLR